MKNELRIFFTALMFYTRIPCPQNMVYSPDYINKASRYFPLIGWIVGGISFVLFYVASFLWGTDIAALVSLLVGVLVTGAFHEDGLADVFDGFGGGWTKTRILEIMKDSRVGAFGVISLIFLFALKFLGLKNLLSQASSSHWLIALMFVSYHSLARLTAVNIVFTSTYSRKDEESKAKPIAKEHSYKEVVGAYLFGMLPLAALAWYHWYFTLILIPLGFLYFYAKRYFEKWIDGYTGDCLGTVEQLAECVIILGYLIIWKYM